MQVDKDVIVDLLKSRGDKDKAQEADSQLPGKVDVEQHADLLERLGIDQKDLLGKLGGLGGLIG